MTKPYAPARLMALLGLLLALTGLPAVAQDSGGILVDFGGSRPADVKVDTNYAWYQDGALTLHDQESSATVTFEIPEGTDPSQWVMQVTDRIANLEPAQQWSIFPNFTLNGKPVNTEAIPWSEFNTTTYPVGQYLRPGKNVLMITATVAEAYEYQVEKIWFGPGSGN